MLHMDLLIFYFITKNNIPKSKLTWKQLLFPKSKDNINKKILTFEKLEPNIVWGNFAWIKHKTKSNHFLNQHGFLIFILTSLLINRSRLVICNILYAGPILNGTYLKESVGGVKCCGRQNDVGTRRYYALCYRERHRCWGGCKHLRYWQRYRC